MSRDALPTFDGKPCAGMTFTIGWCRDNEFDLASARSKLHDQLIALTGERRRGPVTWRWWKGTDAHAGLSRFAADPDTPEHAAVYKAIRARLYSMGGYVVVAACAAEEASSAE